MPEPGALRHRVQGRSRSRPARDAWRPALAGFAALALLLAVAFAEVAAAMANTWSNAATYTHGWLILPIALGLVWLRREALRGVAPRQEPWMLLPLLLFSAVWLVGHAAETNLVQELALVGLLIALAVFSFGRAVARRLWFPLLFLVFMVPMGDALVPLLQDFTAGFAVGLLRLLGIPVFHDGILIQTPTGLFEVAEACAGIRFLVANIVVAALFAYLAYTRWWKATLFLALGVVLPVLANGVRAAGIIVIAYHTDNEMAVGADHLIYGWGFFTLVMIVLLLIGNRFADRPIGRFAPPAAGPAPEAVPCRPWRAGLAVAAVAAMLAGPAYAWGMLRPPPAPVWTAAPPPLNPAWPRAAAAAPLWLPRFPAADHLVLETYRSPDGAEPAGTVDVFVAAYAWQRRGAEVIHHANTLSGDESWIRVETATATLPAAAALGPARIDRLRGAAGRQRLVVSWLWIGGRFTNDPVAAKLFQLDSTLTGRHPAAAQLALSAEIADEPAETLTLLQTFLSGAAPLGSWLDGLQRGAG